MQDLIKYTVALGLTAGLTLTATAQDMETQLEAAPVEEVDVEVIEPETPAAPGSEEAAAETEAVADEIDMETLSYFQGYQMAAQLAGQFAQMGYEIDSDAFAEGVAAAIAREEPKYTQEQVQAAAEAFQADLGKKRDAAIAADKARFDEEMADTSDYTTTDSGLKYKVIREGQGQSPTAQSNVVVDYVGRLEDGTVFDSSYTGGQPAQFAVGGVVPGFSEALQLMKPGASYRIIIPGELAYGEEGRPAAGIGPNATLIFDIELLGELPAPGAAAPAAGGEAGVDVEYQAPEEDAEGGM